jgi:hypothetical protein
VKKPARDETSCPLTKENVKGHCPGVVAIVGMSLTLVSYDHGRLTHDETPYSLCQNLIIYYICFFFFLIECLFREVHLLLKSKGWYREV